MIYIYMMIMMVMMIVMIVMIMMISAHFITLQWINSLSSTFSSYFWENISLISHVIKYNLYFVY